MPRSYAADTEVSVERSKQQLDGLLRQHGARGFASGWDDTCERIEFLWGNLQIRFVLPKPDPKDYETTAAGQVRKAEQVRKVIAQAERQRWRALFLVVRAKLEAVQSGMAMFEEEFLSYIVMSGNTTVGQELIPRIQAGEMHRSKLLQAPSEKRK